MLNLVLAEILKLRKLRFMVVTIFIPLGLCAALLTIMLLIKGFGASYGSLPSDPTNTGPDLGKGVFSFGGLIFLNGIGAFYAIGLVIIGGLIIQSEYNWNTIKMLAIREPSRPRLILAKAAFMALYTVVVIVFLAISWLIYSMGLKILYDLPFSLDESDGQAILKGLRFVVLAFAVYLIWSLLGMALAIQFKSMVAAIIAYLVYSGLDGILSSIGGSALTGRLGTIFPEWLDPLINISKFVAPFLINTSLTRLTGQTSNSAYVESISPIQSLLVLLAWGILFTLLAVRIFSRRDITD